MQVFESIIRVGSIQTYIIATLLLDVYYIFCFQSSMVPH